MGVTRGGAEHRGSEGVFMEGLRRTESRKQAARLRTLP